MTRHLKGIYEGGVFRPLEPVEIAEHQEVSLLVEMPDEQPPDAETDMPIWEYAAQLMRDIPEDVLNALPTDGVPARPLPLRRPATPLTRPLKLRPRNPPCLRPH